MKKRIMSIMLVICIVLALLPSTAEAEEVSVPTITTHPANQTVTSNDAMLTVNMASSDTKDTASAAPAKPATPSITINKQPAASTTVTQGKITGNLTVEAKEITDKKVTYQWAVSKTDKNPPLGTKIPGETKSTFKIPTNLKAGTYYYFCVISAQGAESKRTNIAKVVVKAPTPAITINKQPAASTTVTQGKITGSLTVEAKEITSKKVTYQWAVSKTDKNPPVGTKISGETKSTFKIPTNLKAGTYYYFCVISAQGAESKRTNIAKVVVKAPATQASTPSKDEVKIVAYPKKRTYKVGEGFDTSGVNVVLVKGNVKTNINNKISYVVKNTNGVQLTQGRKFSTSGKKVVEIRYEGKVVSTFTINVT